MNHPPDAPPPREPPSFEPEPPVATESERRAGRGAGVAAFAAGFVLALALGAVAFWFWQTDGAVFHAPGPGPSVIPPTPLTATPTTSIAPPHSIASTVTEAMATPPAVTLIPDAEDAYAFEVRPELDRLPAELLVLNDETSVRLHVEVRRRPAAIHYGRELDREIRWEADAGRIESEGDAYWFHPPETAQTVTVRAEFIAQLEQGTVRRHAQVRFLTPVSSTSLVNGRIDGCEIGWHPDPMRALTPRYREHPERYRVPPIFYKVTAANRDLEIAPGMTLGFWAMDFPWYSLGLPQYIALDLNLVNKLHAVIQAMRADGYSVTRFTPVYGFRSPAYNLGQIHLRPETNLKTVYSMHQYGKAADLIIDEDGDGIMDDLDGNGVIDVYDAAVVMHYVNILDRRWRAEGRMEMVGGAGLYDHTDFVERAEALGQTPYIHIDTRGFLNQWGHLTRWPACWPGTETPIGWGSL